MKYLSILQELFESDTVIFMLAGLVVALVAGTCFRNPKKAAAGAGISLLVYVACEMGTYLFRNFLTELILLFVGTMAIGCVIGFLAGALVGWLRRKTT